MKKALLIALLYFTYLSNLLAQNNIDVIHYDIHISVPNSYNTYIEGFTSLEIRITKDNTSAIDLSLQKLSIDSIIEKAEKITYSYNDTIIQIALNQAYQKDDTLKLSVYYHGNATKDPSGFGGYYSMSGIAFNLGVAMQDVPHNYGRVWFPCVDNFTDRALYDFYITTKDNQMAVCGGNLVDSLNNGDGTKMYHWNLQETIPTYLASIAVADYKAHLDTFTGVNGKIPIAIYVPENLLDKVPGSFAQLKPTLQNYETMFGPYLWERVGYVGVPFTGGAMEHATNIAYPNATIDGTTAYETLWAHELSHHWFGDLVTCSTAEDMWLNEAWASYCEALFTENIYGEDAFKAYNRSRHKKNLQYLPYTEGCMPIYGIPQDLTYGDHVYKKGADVVHSLRNYLGDDVFFLAVQQYLDYYKYQAVSSYDLRDFLTTHTPYNLNDFFDDWVFTQGWVHFSVDSFTVRNESGKYNVDVFMRQKRKNREAFANNNRVPISFISSTFERLDTVITFSGAFGHQAFTIDFEPSTVICDLDEKVSDATIDEYKMIKETQTYDFSSFEFFKTTVNNLQDSALLQVTHNWVWPDGFKEDLHPGLCIHPQRYWKIDGVWDSNFKANGQFYFSRSSSAHLDRDFVNLNRVDSMVIVYRSATNKDWQIVPSIRSGSSSSGFLTIDNLKKGEYAIAVWDNTKTKIKKLATSDIKLYPNPNNGNFVIKAPQIKKIIVMDANGKKIAKWKYANLQNEVQLSLRNKQKGIYFIQIHTLKGIFVKKIIKK